MKILHITPHLGGGVGTVILDWVEKDKLNDHTILCLDSANKKACNFSMAYGVKLYDSAVYLCMANVSRGLIQEADIVLLHFWNHDTIPQFLSLRMPDCRMVFWCHKNYQVPEKYLSYPDLFIDTSPIQGHGRYIWSTGNMERFFAITPKEHKGFNIGYVGTVDYKKMHPDIIPMCREIKKHIPEARFTFVGKNKIYDGVLPKNVPWTFTGKVDDIAPYLAEMDVFLYPLRPDHYGTAEQVLGEAMSSGVVPVVMDNPAERSIVTSFSDGYIAKTQEQCISFIDSFYGFEQQARDVLSERARRRAKQLYSINTMISKWNLVFEEMMKEKKKEHAL